jgi:hypothetical protein
MTPLVSSYGMGGSASVASGTPGRYAIYDEIGAGGMATVHIGRLAGPVNFARTVAVKRLHPHLARQPEFMTMFLDEARVAARVRHPNVVTTLDIVATSTQPYLVMEYVQGESLARLQAAARQRGERIPIPVACAIAVGMLHGLHAAHEATNERGDLLGIVHRDVSPHNVMVGVDGVARVLDFGVAKAAGRLQTTRDSRLKGKLAYTAPELVRGKTIARAADVYSAGVVLWEMLAGAWLFAGDNEANVLERVLFAEVAPPSRRAGDVPPSLDAIVLQALARDPARRFTTARAMARALEAAVPLASAAEVGEWVESLARESLLERARKVAWIESGAATPVDDGTSGGPYAGNAAASGPPGAAGAAGPQGVSTGDESMSELPSPSPRYAARRAALVVCAVAAGALALLGRRWVQTGPTTARPGDSTGTVYRAPVERAAAPPALDAIATTVAPVLGTGTIAVRPTIDAGPTPAASPSMTVGHTPARAAPPTLPPSRPRPTRPAPRASCDPPWILDAEGVKQYKLECL